MHNKRSSRSTGIKSENRGGRYLCNAGCGDGRLVNLNIWRDVLVRYSSNVHPTRIGRLGKSTLGTCYVARRVGILSAKCAMP